MTIRLPRPSCARRLPITALATVLALTGCSGDDAATEGRNGSLPAVEAVPARAGSLPLEEELSGIVRARNQVAIRPEISAPVVEVLVRSGQAVERGQALVRLDDAALAEQLRQAEASLQLSRASAAEARARAAEVEAQVVRTRALAAESLVSALEVETQEAQLEAARAAADAAVARVEQADATAAERRESLSRAVVRAPVSGRVGQRNAEVGMVADPGTTLFLLGEFDELIVEVPLTQEMVGQVREGTPAEITAGRAAGEPIRAAITRISPFLEPGSFSTTAEIDIADRPELRPGMFVTVRVLVGASERATLVPTSAVWENPDTGIEGVFVVQQADGLEPPAAPSTEIPSRPREVAFRPVDVLAESRGTTGIAGVGEGEWVVTVGQHLLHERLRVAAEGPSQPASTAARVRPDTWERVLGLQALQREDLLEGFLDKQRRVARALGATLPESEAVVNRVLENGPEASTSPAAGAR